MAIFKRLIGDFEQKDLYSFSQLYTNKNADSKIQKENETNDTELTIDKL